MFCKNGRKFLLAFDGSESAMAATETLLDELLVAKDFVTAMSVTDCSKTWLPDTQKPAALVAKYSDTLKNKVG